MLDADVANEAEKVVLQIVEPGVLGLVSADEVDERALIYRDAKRSTLGTAADQTTDFSAPQSAIDFEVCQISAAVGRGFAGRATL